MIAIGSNFAANLERGRNTPMSFIIEETKETILGFSKGTYFCESIVTLFCFNIISV